VSLDDLENLIGRGPNGLSADRPVVVVIDDDAGIRNSLASVLKAQYSVRTCADGIEGVQQVDKDTGCVILDVKMPTHDGFWVCKHLRKKAPDVPIIFHSAYQDAKHPFDIINEFHPFGYVMKGEKVADLLSLVANAVKHSNRLRETRRTIERLRDAREQLKSLQEGTPAAPRTTSIPPPRSRSR